MPIYRGCRIQTDRHISCIRSCSDAARDLLIVPAPPEAAIADAHCVIADIPGLDASDNCRPHLNIMPLSGSATTPVSQRD